MLGTCGPLSLLRKELTEPFVLMNGDILTTLDFSVAMEYALGLDSYLTIVTKEIVTPFAFGKVMTDGDYVNDIQEKPDISLEILAGIYLMKPPVLQFIPDDQFYNIDTLIKEMLRSGHRVGRYLMEEYWLDIGTVEHYEHAQSAYRDHFQDLKQEAAPDPDQVAPTRDEV